MLRIRAGGRGTKVAGHTRKIKDRGAPGKTPAAKRWFKPKSTMQGWNIKMSAASRRRILSHMVRTQGYATVVRKLNALKNVSTSRSVDRIATVDMKYLKRKYRPKA